VAIVTSGKYEISNFLEAFCLCIIGAGQSVNASAGEIIKLKGDERIVFAGDSISALGLSKRGYITLLEKQLRTQLKPQHFKFFDAGIVGNTSLDLLNRYERDVLSKKPGLVILYIGINDAVRCQPDARSQHQAAIEYKNRLEYMVLAAQKRHALVLICTPSVIGEQSSGENKDDLLLDQIADQARQVSAVCHVPLCDLRKGFQTFLKTENPSDWKKGITTVDGIHLNDVGNRLVAQLMLLNFGLKPR